jgi:hypothetical protein
MSSFQQSREQSLSRGGRSKWPSAATNDTPANAAIVVGWGFSPCFQRPSKLLAVDVAMLFNQFMQSCKTRAVRNAQSVHQFRE